MKMKFLIGFYHDGPVTNIGGLQAIKKLVDVLSEKKDHTVFVLGTSFINKKTIQIQNVNDIYTDDLIVIYPEIVAGNPFNCKHVVRWILYHTIHRREEDSWHINDEYFYFSEYYHTRRQEQKRLLSAYNFRLDEFKNYGHARHGYCHLIKKNNIETSFVNRFNSESIPDTNWPALIEMFNRKKYFLTYDDSTYFICIAALCGCIPIVLYQEKNPDYKEKMAHVKYGVAYGFEEIDHAEKTLHLMRPNLEELERKSIDSINNFIYYWEEKLKL